MKISLRYSKQYRKIYTKQEIEELFGTEDKDIEGLANAATLTLYNPEEPLENVRDSLKMIVQDIELRIRMQKNKKEAKQTKEQEN